MPIEKENLEKKELLLDLNDPRNQNTWVIGTPPKIQESSYAYSKWVQIAYTNTTTKPSREEEFHSHEESEEYYLVIQGSLQVKVGRKTYHLQPLNLLSIPKKIQHKIIRFDAPLQYFTLRVPSAKPEEKTVEEEPTL